MIRLALRQAPAGRLDGSAIRPDVFAALDEAQIARLPLPGPTELRLGDVFDVRGGRSDEIDVEGDLSRVDRLGAGMKGGRLTLHGAVGHDLGARMRRGTIAVSGPAGERAGLQMIAGTLLVLGDLGRAAGFGLKRGSLIAGAGVLLLPSFRLACTYRPVVVDVLLRSLRRQGFDAAARLERGAFRRWIGDCSDLGRGEILEWTQG